MRTLSVGALFKNEEMVLKEWVEHYLYHGAEHFYLIDDNSDDRSVSVLEPYISKNVATIFGENDHPYYLWRQRNFV